jgi:hypothetical protein
MDIDGLRPGSWQAEAAMRTGRVQPPSGLRKNEERN